MSIVIGNRLLVVVVCVVLLADLIGILVPFELFGALLI
jgi:hypothetical protein